MTTTQLTAGSLVTLELFVGIGAVLGGVALTAAPDGALLRMPLTILDHSPFRTFQIPGLALAIMVGGSSLIGATAALRKRTSTPLWAMLAGAILTGWMLAEIAWVGYGHSIQGFYLGLGVVIFALGWTAYFQRRRKGPTQL